MISRLPTHFTDVPSVCLHRADLPQALFSALPPDCVHLGEQFVDSMSRCRLWAPNEVLQVTPVNARPHFPPASGRPTTLCLSLRPCETR